MIEVNLFNRLEGYAQENFTTETLAYILETDSRVKKKFLDLLLRDKPKAIRASFDDCEIETQSSYDIGRPDLQISSNKNDDCILVEVKIRSQDRESQIKSYLKSGFYVAELTPIREPIPHASDMYLGHFFWYQAYDIIEHVRRSSDIHKQFLSFLKARDMRPSTSVTSKELKASIYTVDVVRKFHEIVNGVKEKVEMDWVKRFGTNSTRTSISKGISDGSLPNWLYRAKGWRKKESRFYLWIGIDVPEKRPMFYVGITTPRKKFAHRIERQLREDIKNLKKLGWKKDPAPNDWCYAKFFSLSQGSINKIVDKQAEHVKCEMSELLKFIRKLKSIL